MITIAIAVRDTAAARQYRALLTDSGIDAHFASDIPTLIRVVKGRPIDVVIFDLARNALSINSWLVEVGRDHDLALAPILWIGDGILPEMRKVVEEYRPGMYLPKLPSLDDLKTAINKLIGRIPPVGAPPPPGPTAEPLDEPIWTPGENNIEDALSIFADSGKTRTRPNQPAAPRRPAETIPFPSARQVQTPPAFPGVAPRTAPPAPAPPTSKPIESRPSAPQAGLSEQDLDALAERISGRLASDLLSRLDRNELRRMVEKALAETSLPIA
ncbi:MAG: hypothetical protein AB1752_02455 [Candidatus Zixiibacteriota bacterium]